VETIGINLSNSFKCQFNRTHCHGYLILKIAESWAKKSTVLFADLSLRKKYNIFVPKYILSFLLDCFDKSSEYFKDILN